LIGLGLSAPEANQDKRHDCMTIKLDAIAEISTIQSGEFLVYDSLDRREKSRD
jgi:hypothetical protein